jgi:hypothetical protein
LFFVLSSFFFLLSLYVDLLRLICFPLLLLLQVVEFCDANLELSLNGFLYPEVAQLEMKVRSISDLLISVEERSERMPDRCVS